MYVLSVLSFLCSLIETLTTLLHFFYLMPVAVGHVKLPSNMSIVYYLIFPSIFVLLLHFCNFFITLNYLITPQHDKALHIVCIIGKLFDFFPFFHFFHS